MSFRIEAIRSTFTDNLLVMTIEERGREKTGAQWELQQIIMNAKLANGCRNALALYWLDFEMVVQTRFSTEEY